jgi:transposase
MKQSPPQQSLPAQQSTIPPQKPMQLPVAKELKKPKKTKLPVAKELKKAKKIEGALMTNAYRIRQLQSILDKAKNLKKGQDGWIPSKKRYKYQRRKKMLHARIRHIRDDTHYKIIKYLVENFRIVMIPKFFVKLLSQRKSRLLTKSTVSKMLAQSHSLFLKRLMDKARATACLVVIVNESYTSKTCSSCANINEQLGSKKIFKCPSPNCGVEVDRDSNGSLNICIRKLATFLDFIGANALFQ